MSVSASFLNSQSASMPVNISAAVTTFVNGSGAGFPRIWHWHPTRPGGSGMSFPTQYSRAGVSAAVAAAGDAEWIPYIGGGATGDIPSGQALTDAIRKFRGAPGIGCDQVADDPDGSPSEAMAREILAQGFDFYPEANSKKNGWIQDVVKSYPSRVRPIAEWFKWDLEVLGSVSVWNPRCWGLRELLDMGVSPVVLLTRDDSDGHNAGFPGGLPGPVWAAKKIELTKMLHTISPRIEVVVRPVGMTENQRAELVSLNHV